MPARRSGETTRFQNQAASKKRKPKKYNLVPGHKQKTGVHPKQKKPGPNADRLKGPKAKMRQQKKAIKKHAKEYGYGNPMKKKGAKKKPGQDRLGKSKKAPTLGSIKSTAGAVNYLKAKGYTVSKRKKK